MLPCVTVNWKYEYSETDAVPRLRAWAKVIFKIAMMFFLTGFELISCRIRMA